MIELPVRFYPSLAMMVVGAWITVRGLRSEVRSIRMPAADPAKSMALMQSFRVCIIGLALASLGIAWMTEQLWLALIAAAICGEELFESSMAIGAMRGGGPGVRPHRSGPRTTERADQTRVVKQRSSSVHTQSRKRPRGGAEAPRVLCYVVPKARV